MKEIDARVMKDYLTLIDIETKKDKEEIIDNAYRIACYNEIFDFLQDLDEEDDLCVRLTKQADYIVCNLIDEIYQYWLDIRHPESYNFFMRECLYEIVESFVNFVEKANE